MHPATPYLPFVLDRDLTSGDDLEFFIAAEKPDGAVSISFNEIIRIAGNSPVLLGLSDNRRAVMNESVSLRDNRAHGRARNPVLFGRASNGSAVSHLANNCLFIDGRVARPAEILTLRFRSIDAYLHTGPPQTALEPRSRFFETRATRGMESHTPVALILAAGASADSRALAVLESGRGTSRR